VLGRGSASGRLSDSAFFPLYPVTEEVVAETLGVANVARG
jgi:hypothetical protein